MQCRRTVNPRTGTQVVETNIGIPGKENILEPIFALWSFLLQIGSLTNFIFVVDFTSIPALNSLLVG